MGSGRPRRAPAYRRPDLTLVVVMLLAAAVAFAAIGWRDDRTATTEPVLATSPLFDDDGGDAMFALAAMEPDIAVQRCVQVGYGGPAVPGTVRLTAADVRGALAGRIAVTVERGTGGRYGDCAGFRGAPIYAGTLRDLADDHDDGLDTGWSPGAGESAAFRVTVRLAGQEQPAPGAAAAASFVWQLRGPAPVAPQATGGTPAPPGPASPAPSAAPSSAASPSSPATGAPTTSGAVPAAPPAGRTASTGGMAAVLEDVRRFLEQAGRYAAVPIAAIVALLLFLLVQSRLDQRDPKLALAPVWADDHLWIPESPEQS
ncbi:hypothetical protein [Spirilliplanes yamanashiensis]|uniref:Uncharacterized protein n=1 Tax=Spirilliplanes yamanashiensis TaxID=42233 RepID=A0A8J3Y6Y9_9ACTN|nr:hypothetical protein [Spirilliplanes yamanashiensis]MDP9815004.1 hypothetical protein [Spirilliplanes yamanashiensis]GIJ02659.1 hypothetical protein Sya03_20110 [Spirilliplanes yamanashiensis]